MSIKRVVQVKIFQGSKEEVEQEINQFIQVFAPDMIRSIQLIPMSPSGTYAALVQFESVML